MKIIFLWIYRFYSFWQIYLKRKKQKNFWLSEEKWKRLKVKGLGGIWSIRNGTRNSEKNRKNEKIFKKVLTNKFCSVNILKRLWKQGPWKLNNAKNPWIFLISDLYSFPFFIFLFFIFYFLESSILAQDERWRRA